MSQAMSEAVAFLATVPTEGASETLLEELEPPPGAHALVIGYRTLETLCGLIRRGCAGGTELRPGEPGAPRPDAAQIAVLPDPTSLPEAVVCVAIARRALTNGGRIAIRNADGLHRRELVALLRAQGFVAISTRDTPDGALVLGERPRASARA
jgi:hypothetical protein